MRSSRRINPQDALRWAMGMFLSAVIASAVTSAVFLAARREEPPVDHLQQRIDSSQAVIAAIAPNLEAAAAAYVSAQAGVENRQAVDAVYSATTASADEEVPMVAPNNNMLMRGAATHWELALKTSRTRREYARIVDIRQSASLTNPGYIATVAFTATKTEQVYRLAGETPFSAPDGFEVITPAKYTELAASPDYQVQPASLSQGELRFSWENWTAATQPPAELPAEVQRQFNEAVVQCSAGESTTSISEERVTFFSLSDAKWTPRP